MNGRLAAALRWTLLAGLVLAACLPAPHVALWPDPVRDLSASLDLARGERVPLAGPPINFGPHLGPAWTWLQALPLLVAHSLAAVSVFVALVGAFKLVLLYLLGRQLSGPRLGLCFVAAATFPSIAAYQWHVFFHPNWVEAAIVASLAMSVSAVRAASIARLYAAAALLGLAIQMHPTALFYLPFVLFALGSIARGRARLLHGVGALATIGAWFLPLPFAGEVPHAQLAQAGAGRIGAGLAAFQPAKVLTVLHTAHVEVPLAIGETYAAWMPAWAWKAFLLLFAAVAAAGFVLALARRGEGARAPLALLALLLLAGWAIATAVRDYTSFYLCYFLLPLTAIVMGLALDRAASSAFAPLRALAWAAMGASILSFVATAATAPRVLGAFVFESRLPYLTNLQSPAPGAVRTRIAGAAARDRVAAMACEAGGATFHGDLAHAFGGSMRVDFRLHCPQRAAAMRLLGPVTGRAWTAIGVREALVLGRSGNGTFRGLALYPVKSAPHPPAGRAIEADWYHFEQLRDREPLQRVTLAFPSAPGEALMIARLKPFAASWKLLRVERDGAPAAALLETYNSAVYAGTGAHRWLVEFETDAPQWVDVHTF